MSELLEEEKKQIIAYAKFFTGAKNIYFHKFANRPGYMLVIETKNLKGFQNFIRWMKIDMERNDIEIIRTVPEEEV